MPNHVTNRLFIAGDEADIQQLFDRAIKPREDSDEFHLDFNAYVPMPDDLKGTVSGGDIPTGLALLGYEGQSLRRMVTMDDWSHDPIFIGKTAALLEIFSHPWVKSAGIENLESLEVHLRETSPEAEQHAREALDRYNKYGHMDWYSWSNENWGTKWNAYDYKEVGRGKGQAEIVFETAWSVPWPVLNKMATEHPELVFQLVYFDEGWNFAGIAKCVGSDCRWEDKQVDTKDGVAMRAVYKQAYGHEYEDNEEGDD